MGGLIKRFLLVLFVLILSIIVYAGDYCNGPVACGSNPTDNCDVNNSVTFDGGTHNLPNGVDICASGITLDCNGSTLNGVNTGILFPGTLHDVTIQNCNLVGYSRGIFIQSNDLNITIRNNFIKNSAFYGIDVSGSKFNTIYLNNIINSGTGIFLNGPSNNIFNNTLSYNTGNGIYLTTSGNALSGNYAYANYINGIYLSSSSYNTLSENTAQSNNQDGIRIDSSNYNLITSNNVLSNFGSGVNIYYSPYNTLMSNIAQNNFQDGIKLINAFSNNLTSNIAIKNKFEGFSLQNSNANYISSNRATRNSASGFSIIGPSNSNILVDNIVNRNFARGIGIVAGDQNSLITNRACANPVDIYQNQGYINSGVNNSCKTVFNWNDQGKVGCTFDCSLQPKY